MIFRPNDVLRAAYHQGKMDMNLENMMNYGILVHSKEKRDEILKERSFDVWLKNVSFNRK